MEIIETQSLVLLLYQILSFSDTSQLLKKLFIFSLEGCHFVLQILVFLLEGFELLLIAESYVFQFFIQQIFTFLCSLR
jgi:hypothetical protein